MTRWSENVEISQRTINLFTISPCLVFFLYKFIYNTHHFPSCGEISLRVETLARKSVISKLIDGELPE